MGLSASVKALALYWMQSMVRFSFPLFYTDDRSFTDGKDFAIDLVQAFTLEDDVKLLMGLMGMEESAVLAWDQRLETQFAACRTDGLADEDFPMEDSRSHREFIADDLIP